MRDTALSLSGLVAIAVQRARIPDWRASVLDLSSHAVRDLFLRWVGWSGGTRWLLHCELAVTVAASASRLRGSWSRRSSGMPRPWPLTRTLPPLNSV